MNLQTNFFSPASAGSASLLNPIVFPGTILGHTGSSPADVINEYWVNLDGQETTQNDFQVQYDVSKSFGVRAGFQWTGYNVQPGNTFETALGDLYFPNNPNRGNCAGLPLNPDDSCTFVGVLSPWGNPTVAINNYAWTVGAWYQKGQLNAHADATFGSANNYAYRIDPRTGQNINGSVTYTPKSWLSAGGNLIFQRATNYSDTGQINFNEHNYHAVVNATVTPNKYLAMDVAYSFDAIQQNIIECFAGSYPANSPLCFDGSGLLQTSAVYNAHTLLINMILQDIENGEGIAVLDPHGDLIDEILGRIPERRAEDVLLLDPSDEAYPVGFNVLQANSEIEKNLLGSDLVAVFRRLSTSWGDQMTSVLGNAVLAFLESTTGGSLVDLRRFLVDAGFRATFLKTVRDPEVVYYWERTFPILVGKPQGPILTRLDTFLRPKLIRYMVAQKENRFDLAGIMNEGKIFLAKLAQGAIGEENAYLLGTLLVSKFQQLAMSRQQTAAALRRNFYLYIDEFHNFVTPSMAAILSGARKYRLGLILAHQELQQLTSRDADVASAVIANPYTRICFRLGDFDAKKLADGFSFFEAKDLQNLQVGEAICRVERAEFDFNLKTRPLPVIDAETARKRREQLVALSREHYARPREAVEATLIPAEAPSPPSKPRVATPEKQKKEASSPPAVRAETSEPAQIPEAMQIPGRGGPQHKYLQDLIKRWAEDRGYAVTVEKRVLDGLGIVDLVLEKRGATPIACEISVTTSAEHELQNAAKCLAAGFENVFLVAPDKDTLGRVRTRASSILTPSQMKKVRFVLPEQVFASVSVLESRPEVAGRPAEETKELLTAKEVEELLRIDVKTIYNYVQRGLIPYVRIQSNLRFVKSEVLAWVAEHRSGGKNPRRK